MSQNKLFIFQSTKVCFYNTFSVCKQPTMDTILEYSYGKSIEGVIEACVVVKKPTRNTDLLVTVTYRGCGK